MPAPASQRPQAGTREPGNGGCAEPGSRFFHHDPDPDPDHDPDHDRDLDLDANQDQNRNPGVM